jgi:hypothetical protein
MMKYTPTPTPITMQTNGIHIFGFCDIFQASACHPIIGGIGFSFPEFSPASHAYSRRPAGCQVGPHVLPGFDRGDLWFFREFMS